MIAKVLTRAAALLLALATLSVPGGRAEASPREGGGTAEGSRADRVARAEGKSPMDAVPCATPVTDTDVHLIWDRAPHQAFTDLVRFKGRWFCVFREGSAHVSPDGAIRVLTSRDGTDWKPAALVSSPTADLRDPKVIVAPGNRLMLVAAGALRPPATATHQTYVWFSTDGRSWSEPAAIGDPNVWIWRVVWHRGTAYGIGYATGGGHFVRLYTSADGKVWRTLVETLFDAGFPNEAALVFQKDDSAVLLLRRDGANATGQLGTARPPYKEWSWKDLGKQIGGPQMIALPDGRLVTALRLYDGGARTSLAWVDPEAGTLTEFERLPSGGDTSYPGLVWWKDRLWVSYYSSHEGKTSIYRAVVQLPATAQRSP
ncbi:MAG TPA: sialidase family protein [Armatimonadota bacterium]|jgi:hypothetical protein